MWKPPINFITLHYSYILCLGLLGFIIIYPYGNVTAVDSYFFGVSASTESGLNTVDVKDLETYQQLFIYFIPIIANLGFINIMVVVVRLYWFEKHLRRMAPQMLRESIAASCHETDCEASPNGTHQKTSDKLDEGQATRPRESNTQKQSDPTNSTVDQGRDGGSHNGEGDRDLPSTADEHSHYPRTITFEPEPQKSYDKSKMVYVPGPRERDRGKPFVEVDEGEPFSDVGDNDIPQITTENIVGRRRLDGPSMINARSVERVASSLFVLRQSSNREEVSRNRAGTSFPRTPGLPYLSSQVTIGRNSRFQNLTSQDRERLGGIEYRSLRVLLKIVLSYFIGLHILGAICLVCWIQGANPKYLNYLEECGQDKIWWGFYSAQTMVNNLGFTLTPDSMVRFQDATFPMIIMSFLAYAGNTCYPCLLRFVIWAISKLASEDALKESLQFLLDHPRRCYTLLFPRRLTWILFGILFVLNVIDVLLIIVLDLHNPAVNNLAGGPRVLAAIFQAASSRHTGTSTFNLAGIHPAVQFSLLVMMYISVYPIAISIRASNSYEEQSIGVYLPNEELDESKPRSYVINHVRNQLSFDLWYIFLGIFCICVAESDKIRDPSNPAFAVFPIFFEVVSAYGNVGLSLGHPSILTSLCGKFTTFSKVVICAMMIRGRHRGLPHTLDRAIMLPNERLTDDMMTRIDETIPEDTRRIDRTKLGVELKKYHTS